MEMIMEGEDSFTLDVTPSGEDLTDSLLGSSNPSSLNPDDMITIEAVTEDDDFILLEMTFEIMGADEVKITVKDLGGVPIEFDENPQTVSAMLVLYYAVL